MSSNDDAKTIDEAFARRLASGLRTVQAWDANPQLLRDIRARLPWDNNKLLLRDQQQQCGHGRYAEPPDFYNNNNSNVRFLQRLARWFSKDFMTWVNQPPCRQCQQTTTTVYQRTRGPETDLERTGDAARVEVYHCTTCSDNNNNKNAAPVVTTFPRYNQPATLLHTRRGRCGEYANLFGAVCRAVGLETRYCMDWTDHVWLEVRIVGGGSSSSDGNYGEEWIMVDPCEGVVQEPSVRATRVFVWMDGWRVFIDINNNLCVPTIAKPTVTLIIGTKNQRSSIFCHFYIFSHRCTKLVGVKS